MKTGTVQARHSRLPFHPLEKKAQTTTEFKRRCLWWHLQMSAQFCPGILCADHESSSVRRCLKWGKINSTCSSLWDPHPFSCTETHTIGSQRVAHGLPTPHTQLTHSLCSKTVNQDSGLPLLTQLHVALVQDLSLQTGTLTFVAQVLVCV